MALQEADYTNGEQALYIEAQGSNVATLRANRHRASNERILLGLGTVSSVVLAGIMSVEREYAAAAVSTAWAVGCAALGRISHRRVQIYNRALDETIPYRPDYNDGPYISTD